MREEDVVSLYGPFKVSTGIIRWHQCAAVGAALDHVRKVALTQLSLRRGISFDACVATAAACATIARSTFAELFMRLL